MRKEDKIKDIKHYLEELDSIVPDSLEEYTGNIEKKAACERYVEKIVEAVIDLAFLIIKEKKFDIPEDDIDAFNILERNKIIKGNLAKRLKNAKGMRNFIVHQYGKINDEIVFDSISQDLPGDIKEFLKSVR